MEPFQRSLTELDVDVMINGRRRDHGFERAQLEVHSHLLCPCSPAVYRWGLPSVLGWTPNNESKQVQVLGLRTAVDSVQTCSVRGICQLMRSRCSVGKQASLPGGRSLRTGSPSRQTLWHGGSSRTAWSTWRGTALRGIPCMTRSAKRLSRLCSDSAVA